MGAAEDVLAQTPWWRPKWVEESVASSTPGKARACSRTSLNTRVAAAKVRTRGGWVEFRAKGVDKLLNLLYVLLALSVVVSLFGMINTLVLSVFERTRELGMLRAVGMVRRQARQMITHESIVTALIGATLGMGIGLLLSVLVTQELSSEGFVLAIPYRTLLYFVIAAIIVGILAAVLPARRASRLRILEALQYD